MASGRRLVLSPFVFPAQADMAQAIGSAAENADADSMALDLLSLSPYDQRVSTSVNSSARFPWIEPAGRVQIAADLDQRYTYDLIVDGSYYEPSGAATLDDLIADIVEVCRISHCRPLRLLVIQINSDPTSAPASYAPSFPPRRATRRNSGMPFLRRSTPVTSPISRMDTTQFINCAATRSCSRCCRFHRSSKVCLWNFLSQPIACRWPGS